jgi:membrane-associated protease RseP (regulator of RpoE activity)
MQADLAELRQRIVQLEQHDSEQGTENDAAGKRPERPKTPEAQRDALLRAGVAAEVADDIVWRRAQVSLDRLDLRDQAIREGWLNTDRYREELRKINQERVSVRDEIGVDSFDRYLFETGQDNRVLVDSIIPGSAGEESGMLPGDVIENYGEQKVFNFRDLRGATSDGERGELVPVVVRRGGQRLELWLPRGPIGIGLDATRVDPQG